MKVKFSKEVEFRPQWKNNHKLPAEEQIVAILRPVSTYDLMEILEGLSSYDKDSGAAGQMGVMKEFLETAPAALKKYCSVSGLYNGDAPVTIEEICSEPFYMELVVELLSELSSISLPNEGEEKNSQKRQD